MSQDNVWERYEQYKARTKKLKFFQLFSFTLFLLFILGMFLVYFFSLTQDTESPVLFFTNRFFAPSESLPLIVAPEENTQPQIASDANEVNEVLEFKDSSNAINDLQVKINLVESPPPSHPLTQVKNIKNKPHQLIFQTIDGEQTFDHIHRARRVKSTQSGVATEWDVPVWYQPAWIPGGTCGELGTVSFAGHVSWYERAGPFEKVGTIQIGSVIQCSVNDTIYTYTVEEVFTVLYSDTHIYSSPLNNTDSTLILFTCTPEVDGIIVAKASISS